MELPPHSFNFQKNKHKHQLLHHILKHPAELMLLTFVWDKTASGTARSKLKIYITADLLLVLVWDETASGTARSKTETRQLSLVMLLLTVPEAVSSHTKMRSRYKLCSSFSVLLLAVPEAVSSHTKTRRISSTRSQLRQERVPRWFPGQDVIMISQPGRGSVRPFQIMFFNRVRQCIAKPALF